MSNSAHPLALDELQRVADSIKARAITAVDMPVSVGSGTTKAPKVAGTVAKTAEPVRWDLVVGGHYGKGGVCSSIALDVSPGAVPAVPLYAGVVGGLDCTDQGLKAPVSVAVNSRVEGSDEVLVSGTAGDGIEKVRITPTGGAPVTVDVVGRDLGLPVGFWVAPLPAGTKTLATVGLTADGSERAAGTTTFDPSGYSADASSSTAGQQPPAAPAPPKQTLIGPAVTMLEGDDAGGHWKLIAAPASTGAACVGIGYGDPQPAYCYSPSIGEAVGTSTKPDLAIGLVKNNAQKVVVTFADDSKVTMQTSDVPAALGATDLKVFVVARPAGSGGDVKQVEKFDAAGKSLGLVGMIASVTLLPAPAP